MSTVSEDGPVWSGWDAFARDFARQVGVAEDSEAPVKKVFQVRVKNVSESVAPLPTLFFFSGLRRRGVRRVAIKLLRPVPEAQGQTVPHLLHSARQVCCSWRSWFLLGPKLLFS